jgi:hypothetical protein
VQLAVQPAVQPAVQLAVQLDIGKRSKRWRVKPSTRRRSVRCGETANCNSALTTRISAGAA